MLCGCLRDFDGAFQALSFGGNLVTETEFKAALDVVGPGGEHHIDHSPRADNPSDADSGSTSGEDCSLAFGQSKERRRLRYARVAGCRELKPSADDGSLKGSDHGKPAVLNLVKGPVPLLAHAHELRRRSREARMFLEIKPRAKVLPFGRQDDHSVFRRASLTP